MTKEQALALVARVSTEEPRIQAVCDAQKEREDGKGYRVQLYLPADQRTMTIRDAGDWESIRDCWRWVLDGDACPLPERPPERVRHVVDGIPMTILRRKDGAWTATYTQNGKTDKKYFGKVDPRGRYPIWTGEQVNV